MNNAYFPPHNFKMKKKRNPDNIQWNPNRSRFDPQYKLWRLAVFKRDGFKCKKCGMTVRTKHLQAHHIYSYADHPAMRFDVNNGITLCYECHKEMFKNESAYIHMCRMLIGNMKTYMAVKKLLLEEERKDNESEQI